MSRENLQPEEFEEIYLAYRDSVWKFLVSLTRNVPEAEDLLQNVFLKLLELTGQGRVRRDGLRPFIFTMAYNRYLDAYRRKRFESKQDPAEISGGGREDRRDESARIQDIIDEALADPSLSDRARAVLKMRLLGRLKIEEICQALMISRSTVYADLQPAMDMLRKAFDRAGLTPGGLE